MPTLHRIRAGLGNILLGHGGRTVEERNYRNLMLSGLWFGPIEGGIFTYLPVFLARLGASASVISLLTSAPSFLGIVTYLPGGAYVERQSNLVRVLVRAVLISRAFYPLIILAPLIVPGHFLPLVIAILWTLASLPAAIHMPAFAAMMQRAIPAQRRAKFNGTRWGLMSLISGAMIVFFGFMLDRTAFPLGYQIVFMVSLGASLMNLYYFNKVEVAPVERVPDGSQRQFSGETAAPNRARERLDRLRHFLLDFAAHPSFIRFNVASFSFRVALMMPAGLYSIYWVQELRANDSWIGLRGTAGYAALVLGYALWGRMANRIGHRVLLLACGIIGALYPVTTAWAPSVEWLLLAAAFWGITISGVDIGLFDMMLISAPADRMPSFAAFANVLNNIALAVGPLLGAGLAGLVGIRTALLVIGGLQLMATAGFLLLPNREQEKATAH
jgi:MFS family permease